MAIILTGNTLSGFIRPSDPIDSAAIASAISTALSKTVSVVVTSTDVLVTGNGSTLILGDGTVTQTAITAYYYPYTQIGLQVADNQDMSASRHDKAITEHAAYNADVAVAALANRIQSGSSVETGAWAILRKASTNSSGVATIYLTTDGTSGAGAAFSTVYEDGIIVMPIGSGSNYQTVSVVLSGDKKSIAVTVNQLGSVVLGLVNVTSAAAGVEVRAAVWGK